MNNRLASLLPELVLLVVLAALLAWNVGMFDIDPYGELFHIQSARETLAAGRFATPLFNGHDYLIRAPFWTWILTVFFKVLGVSLWAARLPAILFALLGLVLTYMLTLVLSQSRTAALFAAAVLGGSWGFFQLGVLSTADVLAMDIFLAFALALVNWVPLAGRRHTMPTELNVYSAILAALPGLLLLVKGSFSVLLLLAVGGAYLAWMQSLDRVRKINWRVFLPVLVLIPLPWLMWVSVQTGNGGFALDYLVVQPVSRLLGMGYWEALEMDWLLYLKRWPIDLMPFLLFVPALVMDGILSQRGIGPRHPWLPWLVAWSLLGLLVYTVSVFKEPTLMLPFYPPVAVLLGYYLGRSVESVTVSRAFGDTLSVYVILLMSAAVFMTIVIFQVVPGTYVLDFWRLPGSPVIDALDLKEHHLKLPEIIPLWKLWLTPGPFILLLGGLLLFVFQLMRRFPMAVPVLLGTGLAFLLFIKALYLPVMHRPVAERFAEHINRQAQADDTIVLYSLHPDVKRVLFYLDEDKLARTRLVRKPEQMADLLTGGKAGTVYGVIREGSFFTELDYGQRNVLQVKDFAWKLDAQRLNELWRLLTIRQPSFKRMQSNLMYFNSVPSAAVEEIRAEIAPDPTEH